VCCSCLSLPIASATFFPYVTQTCVFGDLFPLPHELSPSSRLKPMVPPPFPLQQHLSGCRYSNAAGAAFRPSCLPWRGKSKVVSFPLFTTCSLPCRWTRLRCHTAHSLLSFSSFRRTYRLSENWPRTHSLPRCFFFSRCDFVDFYDGRRSFFSWRASGSLIAIFFWSFLKEAPLFFSRRIDSESPLREELDRSLMVVGRDLP